MIQELSLTGSVGWGLLLVPLAVLLASALLTQWTWGKLRRTARRLEPGYPAGSGLEGSGRADEVGLYRAGAGDGVPGGASGGVARAEPAGLLGRAGHGAGLGELGRLAPSNTETGEHRSHSSKPAAAGAQQDVERAPAVRRVFAVRELIADAEKTGDRKELAKLCLAQARYLREGGELREAGDLVRKCILIAIEMRDNHLHAQGRLELGDIAETLGDLTTACEHWQMARSLFTEIEEHQRSESAEQRMLKRGCPTDWVLTDF